MSKFCCIAILRDIQPNDCEAIVKTLLEEGITKLEISLSNEEIGYQSIERILEKFKGQAEIGAGTVTTVEQISVLKKLGVDFIITPAYDDELVQKAKEVHLEIIPGVFTPQDVMRALNQGVTNLKLFPFDALPYQYIKSLKGPFPKANFFAVGGVTLSNVEDIYRAGFIGIAPGSDLVNRGSTVQDIELIKEKAKQYVEVVKRCMQEI
ncbi:MAG: bifunctional 4-hydroxy-2-oxoglutarate aldolase/2-dehydro-3-deoxy-phosphogluconate aldolase [Anaerorhabdus sp.]